MSKKAYVITFMILAFTFVPVFFSEVFAPVSITSPCSYVACNVIAGIPQLCSLFASYGFSKGTWFLLAIEGFQFLCLAFYCGLFYLCARLTYTISAKSPKVAGKIVFQAIILCLLFSSSFLYVIHCDSFVNATGTYDFWTGAARFAEKS